MSPSLYQYLGFVLLPFVLIFSPASLAPFRLPFPFSFTFSSSPVPPFS